MSIAVINIRDLIKYVLIFCVIAIIIVSGIIVIKGRDRWENKETHDSFSFLNCLKITMPVMAEEHPNESKDEEAQNLKILDSSLAMLHNMEDMEDNEEDIEDFTEGNVNNKVQEETENKKIDIAENVTTSVINENNIEASFTNSANEIKVKNQSKYDITGILANPKYEIKNKNKVVIYHTHTCESYTASEKYNYQMTGAYRTTDLNFSVARVRR